MSVSMSYTNQSTMKFLRLFLFSICIIVGLSTSAQSLNVPTRFHNEGSDTTRITEMLTTVLSENYDVPGQRVERIARMFIDTPYVAHTLEAKDGEDEVLTINIDELDCTTFVETVIAMAITVGEYRSSWRDFVYNLERIRYRGGTLNGYPSRLHYIAEWVIDNTHRGNFVDATNRFPKVNYATKMLDFMSRHRDKYPALADSANYARIRDVETGLRSHRYPYIKTIDLKDKTTKAAFRTGDIVALTSNLKDLDVTHMGIVVLIEGEPYLLHASSSLSKVTVTAVPLDKFMERNRSLTGVRVIRLTD